MPKKRHTVTFIYLFIYLFVVLELKLRAYTLSHSISPIFVMGFFKTAYLKLFAQAGFKPQSS
jgi:hypothetical protein